MQRHCICLYSISFRNCDCLWSISYMTDDKSYPLIFTVYYGITTFLAFESRWRKVRFLDMCRYKHRQKLFFLFRAQSKSSITGWFTFLLFGCPLIDSSLVKYRPQLSWRHSTQDVCSKSTCSRKLTASDVTSVLSHQMEGICDIISLFVHFSNL